MRRQPPVHDQHLAEGADHDVGRRQVAVDDAAGVREGDGIGDTYQETHALGHRAGLLGPRVEALTTHQLHRVEQAAIRQRADVVDRDDAGVFEVRQDAGLGFQPRQRRRVGRAAQHLQRDVAPQRAIGDPIDRAHPAASERLHQLVPRARQVGQIGNVLQDAEASCLAGASGEFYEMTDRQPQRHRDTKTHGDNLVRGVARQESSLCVLCASVSLWLTSVILRRSRALRVRTRRPTRMPRGAGAGRARGSRGAWRPAGW